MALVDSTLLRWLAPLLRWRHAVIGIVGLASALQRVGYSNDWSFIVQGSELLFSGDSDAGLHLYADHPHLQIGPLAFLLATPFRLAGSAGRVAGILVMTAMASLLVVVLERLALQASPADRAESIKWKTLAGGVVVLQVWSSLSAIWGHLDDALVISFAVAALWAAVSGRGEVCGLMIGLAVASKPWGIIALPLVLLLTSRARTRAVAISGALMAAAWLPFLIVEPTTLSALRPTLDTSPASVVHLFGVGLDESPLWIRPVQLGCSLFFASICAWRGRWTAVLAIGVAVRLLLDPGVFPYYSAGFLLVLLLWDLVSNPTPVPLATVGSYWMLQAVTVITSSETAWAVLRLLLNLLLIGMMLALPALPRGGGRHSREGVVEVGA